jgi:hypothetical protein
MLKISDTAKLLLAQMPDIDMRDLVKWWEETYMVIGSAQITEYLIYKNLKENNGDQSNK